MSELLAAVPKFVAFGNELKRVFSEDSERTYSVADQKPDASYFGKTRLIEYVEIKDFKKIQSLKLDLTSSHTDRVPWTMILGENGAGKSSILQAIVLALVGAKYLDKLGLHPQEFIRNGAKSAHVVVRLSNHPEPLSIRIDSAGFHPSEKAPQVLLLAYGATRLMPRAVVAGSVEASYAKADNLFNPFVPVGDAEAWLLGLSKPKFDDFARALKEIFLVLDGPDRLVRRNKKIYVETDHFGSIPLSQLSDGYQSVIGITADIMRIFSKFWEAMEIAEGIVLIDELGAHLHPRWRMRVVSGLRHAFPRAQFIVSSHDPLCLRGLENGEVLVLRETREGHPIVLSDVPDVSKMSVEQILTSEFFGLHSTIDPLIDAKFEEYLELQISSPTPERDERLQRAKAELDGAMMLGSDRRERLMLEVIDEYLAAERYAADGPARDEAKASVKNALLDIWLSEAPTPIGPSAPFFGGERTSDAQG
ncbi:AAA family ATPase (plasmid) [Rhizobium ruizarguesonis]|nr:AAA family ATPase [Rhizobium ruizarguesonis]